MHGNFAFAMGVLAAFMPAFYSCRLMFMTFHGRPRASQEVMSHVHESPQVMLIPLYVLAFGAAFAGLAAYEYFLGHHMVEFWGEALKVMPETDTDAAAHHGPLWVRSEERRVGQEVGLTVRSWWSAYHYKNNN